VASQVGLATGHISAATSASLLTAGLLSAAAFPAAATRLLARDRWPPAKPSPSGPADMADQPATGTPGGAGQAHRRLSVPRRGLNGTPGKAWAAVTRLASRRFGR
jgi:hypothetical protein